MDVFAKFSTVGSQISICDFKLAEKLCLIGITPDIKIYILIYNPNNEVMNRYSTLTYEDIFGEEREAVAGDYLNALTQGGRLPSIKAKDVMYVLMSEYIIDIILIDDLSPRIRIYDNSTKFAEILTNYGYKYINRRINRIEFVEKQIKIKYKGAGVKLGYISNDPYLLLKEVNNFPDFSLTKPTYAWIVEESRQEILAIYTASESLGKSTYKELVDSREDPELRKEIDRLSAKFSQEAGYQVSKQYLTSVFKRLNRELIVLPVDFIRKYSQESYDYIEPLRYKFSVIKNRKDFENILYNSIENNLNGRFKYRFVEKLSGIYLTIGNKLNYTDVNGNLIRKQSIADFNINYNAAVVKRETIIDNRSIPQLLGYIYNDFDNIGTDMLPVPSIEVVFYFPDVTAIGREIEMYNGTAIDLARGDGFTSYGEIGLEEYAQGTIRKPRDPNEKYVTVKYINSDNEILKENIIRDVPIGSIYTPEIIPVINDKEGKEWMVSSNQIPNVQMTNDNSQNIVEVRYVKKIAKVRINYITRQGVELTSPVITNMQVGELFDVESAKKFTDRDGAEWNLYQCTPKRFIVSETEDSNVLTLVYDVMRADVYITYKTRQGKELREQSKVTTVAGKEFTPEIPNFITDSDGCLWEVGNDSKTVIFVSETELNTVELVYDEKKEKVTITFFDDESNKIKDDVVEFVQVGKIYTPKFERNYIDIYGKWWALLGIDRSEIKVQLGPENNIAIVSYEKITSTVMISLLNEQGIRIRDDIVEKAQIGTIYTPATLKEVDDVNGLTWICIDDDNKSLMVTQSEVANRVSYTYRPLITKVYFQYVDDEGNELIPQREREAQAGSMVEPEFIRSLVSEDQRGWVLSTNNVSQFKVNRHKEENIFKINYDKKMVNVTLAFRNVSGVKLKEDISVEAQVGSEYKATLYDKITADNGERWMVAKTEPEVMFVRENARFILIYDEIKARVVVKCINIADDMSIVNDQLITTKLGGVFVPNIQSKIFDKNKCRWKYVGEPAMSIIAKENEQENIIFLKYEPDVAKVTLKFQNSKGQIVHADVVKDEQIGKEIEIKEYSKIIEDDGIGWKLENMSRRTMIVDEEDAKNIVTSTYVPLLAEITTRYIDNDGTEITTSKIDKIQVGRTFSADVLDRVKDAQGRTWVYSNIEVKQITVKDEPDKVNIKYIPLMQNVTSSFLNMNKEAIVINKVESIQVGTSYQMPEVKRIIDEEGKYWIYQKISRANIVVSENPSENVVFYLYDKELIDVTIKYVNDEGETLEKDKVIKLQIGSDYTIEPSKSLWSHAKLGYIISDNNTFKVKISPNKEENVFTMLYEKYMVHVYDKYVNEATEENIINPDVSMHQVGSKYLVTVKETVVDEEGRHWVQAQKGDSILSGSSYKVTPIIVSEEEGKNFTVVKYKPKLVQATIKYLDPLGKSIKTEEQVKLQIGSIFDEDIPKKVVDRVGNKWSFNPKSKANVRISENPMENVIELSYEESKGTVTFKHLDSIGNQIIPDKTELIQIGSHYTPQFDMVVTDERGCVWEYHERDKEAITVSDEDDENIINLTYIPLDIDVLINYVDLWGNDITSPKTVKAQLGSKFTPTQSRDYTNDESLLYRVKRIQPEEITIKEIPIGQTETPNKMTIVFDPVNSDVIIKYVDMNDESLREDERVHLQVGSKYTPEPPQFIKDKRGNEWELVNAKREAITVFENPEQNILMYSYDVAKADIIIRYINVDGLVISDETHVPMQVGQEYVPHPEKSLLDKSNRKWNLISVKPINLKVGSINNIVTVTYQEAKAKVTWKYLDESGNAIRGEERFEVQIGSKYSPKVTNKVIYNESEIWRLVKTDPYEIIISENSNENVVNLIYSNEKVQEEEEKKQEFVNPFANTISKEELEEMRLSEKGNQLDLSNEDALTSNDDTVIFNTEKDSVDTLNVDTQNVIEFTDPYLQQLARGMKLTNEEKATIEALNDINAQIVNEIRKSQDAYMSGSASYDYSTVESLMVKEKDLVKQKLAKIIAEDKTGSRMLKIFEQITASESNDKFFNRIQQKKAILISDYFIDKVIDDSDKIIYIVERGKNTCALEALEEKLNSKNFKERTEGLQLKALLHYEKLMIDNYYKSRTLTNDSYFIDQSSKDSAGPEIAMAVAANLIRQANNIFKKDNLTLAQRIEAEAIIRLCTPEQVNKIKDEVNKLDGKLKKAANIIIKEAGK